MSQPELALIILIHPKTGIEKKRDRKGRTSETDYIGPAKGRAGPKGDQKNEQRNE